MAYVVQSERLVHAAAAVAIPSSGKVTFFHRCVFTTATRKWSHELHDSFAGNARPARRWVVAGSEPVDLWYGDDGHAEGREESESERAREGK